MTAKLALLEAHERSGLARKAFCAGHRIVMTAYAPFASGAFDLLRELAGNFMRRERGSHTLQPTALVHEAYLRLLEQRTDLQGGHLRAIAARTMRRILVDHERRRRAKKRGGGTPHVTLPSIVADGDEPIDLLALDEALQELASVDGRKCSVVELMFFAGLTVRETAENLGVSHRTVEEDWAAARAWLRARWE